MKHTDLNLLFLVHLKIPIRPLDELPLCSEMPKPLTSIRNSFNISKKYFAHFQDVDSEIHKILKGWAFL